MIYCISPAAPVKFIFIYIFFTLTFVSLQTVSNNRTYIKNKQILEAPKCERIKRIVCLLYVYYANINSMCADFESLIWELFKPQLEELAVTQPGSRFTSDDLFSLLESPTNPQVGLTAALQTNLHTNWAAEATPECIILSTHNWCKHKNINISVTNSRY